MKLSLNKEDTLRCIDMMYRGYTSSISGNEMNSTPNVAVISNDGTKLLFFCKLPPRWITTYPSIAEGLLGYEL